MIFTKISRFWWFSPRFISYNFKIYFTAANFVIMATIFVSSLNGEQIKHSLPVLILNLNNFNLIQLISIQFNFQGRKPVWSARWMPTPLQPTSSENLFSLFLFFPFFFHFCPLLENINLTLDGVKSWAEVVWLRLMALPLYLSNTTRKY